MRTRPPEDCFFAGGRRLPAADRLAGGRFRDAVDPDERLREDAAGRRVGVVRAGMRQTVILEGPPTGQAEARVPRLRSGP
jgi:hypothetical protein